MRLGLAVLTALTVAATPALAQPRALTIDDLYDPQKRIDFSGGAPSGLVWMSDTHYLWPRPGKFVSVWRGHDLDVVDVDHRHKCRLTTDGAEEQLVQLLVKHMRQTMLDFTLETLLKPRSAAATTDSGQGRR